MSYKRACARVYRMLPKGTHAYDILVCVCVINRCCHLKYANTMIEMPVQMLHELCVCKHVYMDACSWARNAACRNRIIIYQCIDNVNVNVNGNVLCMNL